MREKIKTLIIEDEQEDLDLMSNLLKAFPEIELMDTARDVETGIAAISHHKPELVFLDINLYGRTSFEILDIIKRYNMQPKIIFTTALNNYMNQAFKYAAFDYLLKPIDRSELKNTVN
jgi:two-component system, LytTR family, response regulator